jgi:hypothetical protein
MLRPVANLFAVRDPDPAALDAIERRLKATDDFSTVWRPAPEWVAAQASLPHSKPDDDSIRARGFAFAEGRDRLEAGGAPDWVAKVARLTDEAPDRLDELPGDFSFLRFREDSSVSAVRSCAGHAPMYLHRDARGRVAVGTLLRYFVDFLPDRFEPDPLINVAWVIASQFIDDRTFLRGVSILPPASHTQLEADGALATIRYWDPRPEAGETPEPDPEHAHELRELLVATLRRDLDPAGGNLIALSGGVDSSSLAALAAGTLDFPLSSWSMIAPYEPERSHELSFIEPLAETVGIEPVHLCERTDAVAERWATEFQGLPFQVINPGLCELPRIRAQQKVRVYFGGEFADDLAGHAGRLTDWAVHTSPRSLFRRARDLPFGGRDRLRWAKRGVLNAIGRPPFPFLEGLPDWVHPQIRAEYREWVGRTQAARARDRQPLRELADRVKADVWVAQSWEGTTPHGVRRTNPCFNREVLELAFRCHPHDLLGPGPKRLLRDALHEDVPARNLLRPDKAHWRHSDYEDVLGEQTELPAAATHFVRPDWCPRPPADARFKYAVTLRPSIRVAEYLQNREPA